LLDFTICIEDNEMYNAQKVHSISSIIYSFLRHVRSVCMSKGNFYLLPFHLLLKHDIFIYLPFHFNTYTNMNVHCSREASLYVVALFVAMVIIHIVPRGNAQSTRM